MRHQPVTIGPDGLRLTEHSGPLSGQLWASALATAFLFASPVSPVRAAEGPSFEVVAQDGQWQPRELQVPAGVKLRLTLRNTGKTPVEFENLALRIEKVVMPDSASTVTLQPLSAGSYQLVDEFHPAAGAMQIIAR